jgi:hypothetical protein
MKLEEKVRLGSKVNLALINLQRRIDELQEELLRSLSPAQRAFYALASITSLATSVREAIRQAVIRPSINPCTPAGLCPAAWRLAIAGTARMLLEKAGARP